jgi:hypothetical protein
MENKEKWDGRCVCGHKHSQHGPTGSINYTAGRCSVKGCNCAHFIHDNTKPNAEPGELDRVIESVADRMQEGEVPEDRIKDLERRVSRLESYHNSHNVKFGS